MGVDALGFVLAHKSPRRVTADQAAEIIGQIPPFVASVALFMNNDAGEVKQLLAATRVDILQFHGDETAEYCQSFGVSYIKAVPMGGDTNALTYMANHPKARAFLFDSNAPGESGGSGLTFNWDIIPQTQAPIIVAGGLHAGNVAEAVRRIRPYAVDVSSGVEAAKGIKDIDKMRAFVRAVYEGDK
jgi:phosphoribosylanthranilate isomerase